MTLSKREQNTSKIIHDQIKKKDIAIQKDLQNDSISPQIKKPNLAKTKQLIKLSLITQFFPPDYAATGQLLEETCKTFRTFGS